MAGAIATRIAQACAGLLLLLAGCKGGDQPATKQGEVVPPSTELTAEAFHDDYAALAGKDLLTRYAEGVTVSGKVADVVEMGDPEGLEVAMQVKTQPPISIRFADGGKAARRRALAPGDALTVRCRVAGKPADVIFLVDCALP